MYDDETLFGFKENNLLLFAKIKFRSNFTAVEYDQNEIRKYVDLSISSLNKENR
jgi:hypothetical protein